MYQSSRAPGKTKKQKTVSIPPSALPGLQRHCTGNVPQNGLPSTPATKTRTKTTAKTKTKIKTRAKTKAKTKTKTKPKAGTQT